MKLDNYAVVNEFVDVSYDYYGNYSHAAGFLQSIVAGFMDGLNTKESVEQLLKSRTDEIRAQLIRDAA